MSRVPEPLDPGPSGPLMGIRILDLTSVVFGAYATQMLADLGAEVIKIESPSGRRGGGGDIMRWAGDTPGPEEGLGPIFVTINRNKRSALLDLATEAGRTAVLALARSCDAFAASVRYEGLKRLGLAYEDLAAVNPAILYVHGSGYGREGPYAGEPAYDDLIQSAAGLADLLPRTDGDPRPRLLPSLVADKVSGLFMAQALLAGLVHRQRTGEGQFIEVPMFECLASFNLAEHLFGHVYDPPNGPLAYPRVANAHRKPFRTKDGHIGLLPYTDAQWRAFFEFAGWGETVAKDPRFATPQARARHAEALYALLEAVTVTRTTEEWLAILKPLDIPATRTNTLEDLLEDPHLEAVGFFRTFEHPTAGRYRAMRAPLRFSRTPPAIWRHAPGLGEQTAEILREAESSDGQKEIDS